MATILETMEGLALPPGASETLKQGDSLTRHALGMRLAWPRYSPHDRGSRQCKLRLDTDHF